MSNANAKNNIIEKAISNVCSDGAWYDDSVSEVLTEIGMTRTEFMSHTLIYLRGNDRFGYVLSDECAMNALSVLQRVVEQLNRLGCGASFMVYLSDQPDWEAHGSFTIFMDTRFTKLCDAGALTELVDGVELDYEAETLAYSNDGSANEQFIIEILQALDDWADRLCGVDKKALEEVEKLLG